jgi:hypothetical protein
LKFAFENQPKEVVLRPNVAGMERVIDDMVKLKYIDKKPTVDIIDLKFLDDVEAKSRSAPNASTAAGKSE